MKIANNVIDLIGNTPLNKLSLPSPAARTPPSADYSTSILSILTSSPLINFKR